MARYRLPLVFVLLLLLPVGAVLAYPPCGPYQAPNQPSGFCRFDVIPNQPLRINAGLPFVWMRAEPSSAARPIHTLYPTYYPVLVTVGGASHWDGVQWWWLVETYPVPFARGWVEQGSVSPGSVPPPPTPTPTPLPPTPAPGGVTDPSIQLPATWNAPFFGQAEAGLPFIWIRELPNRGAILATIPANGRFSVLNNAAFDGYQWWWLVEFRGIYGWVEQGSITPLA